MFQSLFFLIGLGIFFLSDSASAQVLRVVVDPGHGGTDEGTVYEAPPIRITEKEITLKIARLIRNQLLAKGYRVYLTRDEDHEVALPARTALANRLKADVFISIHVNSAQGRSQADAQGVETYILNSTTDASSRRLAHLENSVISSQPSDTPEQLDVALILKDLRLDANLAESKRLACNVQNRLISRLSKNRDRGVKQALFHVLLGADMPSILVEAGFLSHSSDRGLLTSPKGQLLLSQAITEAVESYKQRSLGAVSHSGSHSGAHPSLSRCKIN